MEFGILDGQVVDGQVVNGEMVDSQVVDSASFADTTAHENTLM